MAYKILVVDDDKDIVEIMRQRLVKEGYEAVVAYDGQEALRKIKDNNPDIILLDLTMPKMNGFEALKEIREMHKDRWRPVIIVTAQEQIESLEKCYQMQADHYLIKPCDIETIIRGVKTMVSLLSARITDSPN